MYFANQSILKDDSNIVTLHRIRYKTHCFIITTHETSTGAIIIDGMRSSPLALYRAPNDGTFQSDILCKRYESAELTCQN